MTQADSVKALGMSLDPQSTSGPGQAEITSTTPLPNGWASFCSKPDSRHQSHWYATAPWDADALNAKHGLDGAQAGGLLQTVDADTWPQLHEAVSEQVQLYEELAGGLVPAGVPESG